MGEVGCVTQQRVEITHNGNDGSSLGVTFLAVLDEKELVDHLVNVAAILGKIEFTTCVIVIFFHKNKRIKALLRVKTITQWVKSAICLVGKNERFGEVFALPYASALIVLQDWKRRIKGYL